MRALSRIFSNLSPSLSRLPFPISGKKYEDDQQDRGGRLREILDDWHFLQFKIADDINDENNKSVDQELQIQGNSIFANQQASTFQRCHSSSVIVSRFPPPLHDLHSQIFLATGGSDRQLVVWHVLQNDGTLIDRPHILIHKDNSHIMQRVATVLDHTSSLLELDWHPTIPGLVVSSSMDGRVCVNRIEGLVEWAESSIAAEGVEARVSTLFNDVVHSKYVTRVRWLRKGNGFLSASHDRSLKLFQPATSDEEGEFRLLNQWDFPGIIESLELTPDGNTVIVGVRDDNYLSYIDLNDPAFEITRVNLNSNGDDHVSFTPMDIQASPSGGHILVSTDKDRLIVIRAGTPLHIRNLYGSFNNHLSQPRAVWHPSGKYVFSTSQDNKIYVWDVVSQKVIKILSGHSAYPRSIHHHPSLELLLTSSYDKTVRMWTFVEESQL